jgi:hypothetical protein
MSSISGEEYKRKYGYDHHQAAIDNRAKKIYVYKVLRGSDLAITYKIIRSNVDQAMFFNSPFVFEPELIWAE